MKFWITALFSLMASGSQAGDLFCHQALSSTLPSFTVPNQIELNKITPGQREIGKFIVSEKAEDKKNSLEVPVIAVRLKSGVYYILQDRHHTMSAYALNKGYNAKVDLNVLEIHDYPEMSDSDYALMIEKKNQLYIASDESIGPNWSFKDDWPQSIKNLIDNPLRSLMKLVMNRYKISGRDFIPFYQFLLNDLALEEGYTLPEVVTYSKEEIDELEEMVFGNDRIFEAFLDMIALKGRHKNELEEKLEEIRDEAKPKKKKKDKKKKNKKKKK